jgi:deoxycytidylate deaminase
VYYKARHAALNNQHSFHVVAILKRGKSIKIGVNTAKTSPRFRRIYKNGCPNYHLHAEMNVLRFAKEGDEITVLRFSAKGELTMALPCEFCRKFLIERGFRKITYSDWDGKLKIIKY